MSSGFGPSADPQHPGYGESAGRPGLPPGYGADAGSPGPASVYGAGAQGPDSSPGYRAAAFRPGEGTGSNPAGRIALVAGIAVVVVGLARQAFSFALPSLMAGYDLPALDTYRRFTIIGGVVTVAIALVALIAGGIGLRAHGSPKGAAGAGFALGAWAVLSTLFGLLAPLILGTGL